MSFKKVSVGNVLLGGEKIAVQSMTTHKTSDVEESVAQILRLEEAGCDIVRVAVADENDAFALKKIKERVHVPVVADVHFSARLAVLAVENGADKLRINPGNIGGEDKISLVADCLKAHGVPVRVGSNSGSIEKHFLEQYGRTPQALVESALFNVSVLERCGVEDIVVSVKAESVPFTVEAYRLLAGRTAYPLHLGVTHAGGEKMGVIKSAAAFGALLTDGIGDTIRVSLSSEPEKEAVAAHDILRAIGKEKEFVEVVSCPTCGRCSYDCLALANKVEAYTRPYKKPLRVAVMGCVVNGPGEARDCDLGIAGGKEYCVIMQKGRADERVEASGAEEAFFKRLDELLK